MQSAVALREGPYPDAARRAEALRLAVWIFVASELMFFAALFGLYAAARQQYSHAFGLCVAHDPLVLGTINTVVLLTSSFTVVLSIHALREGHERRAGALLWGTVALGGVFLGLKSLEYVGHFREGIYPGARFDNTELNGVVAARTFYNLYYAMTGLHALHVIAGMGLLAWIAVAAGRGRLGRSEDDHVHAELVGMYWHLVDIVWLFLWPLFYLLR